MGWTVSEVHWVNMSFTEYQCATRLNTCFQKLRAIIRQQHEEVFQYASNALNNLDDSLLTPVLLEFMGEIFFRRVVQDTDKLVDVQFCHSAKHYFHLLRTFSDSNMMHEMQCKRSIESLIRKVMTSCRSYGKRFHSSTNLSWTMWETSSKVHIKSQGSHFDLMLLYVFYLL